MTKVTSQYNRRNFLKISALTSGGFVLGFNFFSSCNAPVKVRELPSEWVDVNAFLKIGDNGMVTIMSPNPEIGQNIKTSMPMIIAEELDVPWRDVIVEQAPLNTTEYTRQVAGGSQSIRHGWESLRNTGATARQMLVNAAAKKWEVDPSTCSTSEGVISNQNGDKLGYGEVVALAVNEEVPAEVTLKDPKDFKIIGIDTRNVDIEKILSGAPLFGLDTYKEGMLTAVVLRPPAFGQKLKSFDDADAKAVKGVHQVIQFGDKVAVLASSTWAAIKGRNALKAVWENGAKMESTESHDKELKKMLAKKGAGTKRKDGDVMKQIADADKVIERIYEAPFLPHNCLEPMNFYADVTDQKIELLGPIQTPEWTRSRVAELLKRPEEEVSIMMTRMGGGFGRRLYGDFALEAAEISSLVKNPVKVVFTREDDMTAGTYRPGSKYKFTAAIKDGKMTGYYLVGAGVNMRNATRENNFPAGAIKNYLVESHNLESNITTGAWRAPITNFLAFAEQSFFDEVAEELGIDAVKFRLDLFDQAKANPVGEIEYDIDKFKGVIQLVADKSNYGKAADGVYQGLSAYYSHNTYVAEVADVIVEDGSPKVSKMTVAIDCGIVINPIAATNQAEGGVIDGIGHAMYGDFSFENGKPMNSNFDTYRLIRMSEAPEVEIHFVESMDNPTGLGEPTLPPAGGAIANAFFKATGKRLYKQPFVKQSDLLG